MSSLCHWFNEYEFTLMMDVLTNLFNIDYF